MDARLPFEVQGVHSTVPATGRRGWPSSPRAIHDDDEKLVPKPGLEPGQACAH
jgi:hypothetical protein